MGLMEQKRMAAVAAAVVAILRMAAAMAMLVHTAAQVHCAWSNRERKFNSNEMLNHPIKIDK